MKFSFKSPSRAKALPADKQAAREQMLRTLPEELLGQIRGGLVAGCHPPNCLCCCGGSS